MTGDNRNFAPDSSKPGRDVYLPSPEKIARHLAFWRLDAVERPLLGVYLGGLMTDELYTFTGEGSYLSPEQVLSGRLDEGFWRYHLSLEEIDQDLIYPVQPLSSIPWLEAMLGSKVKVQTQVAWAEPVLSENTPLEAFQPAWCPDWIRAAEDWMGTLVVSFTPLGLPVAAPFLRGPADVIAALIGSYRLCYEVLESPEQIRRLALFCAHAWIKMARKLVGCIPAWQGGYVFGARWLYTPGPCTYSSEDIAGIFSPDTYRSIFLLYDKMITAAFPYGFLHRHSPGLRHHVDALLELPTTWAIEVTLDPTGPKVEEILPVLQRIQQARHPLIVFGQTDPDEIDRLVSGLSPIGLCVTVQAETPERARQLLAVARRASEKGL